MSLLRCLLATLAAIACIAQTAAASRLACGVCEALVDEVNSAILLTSHTHSVQTRFRIDEKKRVPYARTEHNLLEIMEAADFPKKFEKYGIVKPHTRTARRMKEAYERVARGETNEEETQQQQQPEQTQTQTDAEGTQASDAATPPAGDAAASASTDGTATPSDTAATPAAGDVAAASTDAASAPPAAPAPAATPSVPYRPRGPLPLSLQHHHVHLVERATTLNTDLVVEHSSAVTSEIKSALDAFLEEYLDEAMLMFHRDVPGLKEKLCMEVTEACKPQKRRAKGKGKNKKTEAETQKDQAQQQEEKPKEEL